MFVLVLSLLSLFLHWGLTSSGYSKLTTEQVDELVEKTLSEISSAVDEMNASADENGEDDASDRKKRDDECGKISCWSEWSEWTECSSACNSGHQIRSRTCLHDRRRKRSSLGVSTCEGDDHSIRECQGEAAHCGAQHRQHPPSNDERKSSKEELTDEKFEKILKILGGRTGRDGWKRNCEHSVWSSWSQCSDTCGEGTKSRKKACMDEQGVKCNETLCKGQGEESMICNRGKNGKCDHKAGLTIRKVRASNWQRRDAEQDYEDDEEEDDISDPKIKEVLKVLNESFYSTKPTGITTTSTPAPTHRYDPITDGKIEALLNTLAKNYLNSKQTQMEVAQLNIGPPRRKRDIFKDFLEHENKTRKPPGCEFTPWSIWSVCSNTCKGGMKMRKRACLDKQGVVCGSSKCKGLREQWSSCPEEDDCHDVGSAGRRNLLQARSLMADTGNTQPSTPKSVNSFILIPTIAIIFGILTSTLVAMTIVCKYAMNRRRYRHSVDRSHRLVLN